jgi:hypothetical protein
MSGRTNRSAIFRRACRLCCWRRGRDSNPQYRCWPVQRFSKRIILAALTHFQGLTVGLRASKSGSGPLIRQLLRSDLCSTFFYNLGEARLSSPCLGLRSGWLIDVLIIRRLSVNLR